MIAHNHAELQLYPVDGNDPALANNYRFGSRVLRNFRATSRIFPGGSDLIISFLSH